MPRVSAWFVRAALCHLAVGFMLGALLLAEKGIGSAPGIWAVRGVHVEMLLVGWMIQLVMGVAIWILPRSGLRRTPRQDAALAWVAFALLNAGVVLVAAGAVAAGRLAEIGAAASLVSHLWRRVTPTGLSGM